ncbi:MAG: hypothetical protein KatS3mg114_0517 [Planctomycetaceae bacterium]|nr:MAG: hypothetical protein KatS3mg114_0517 [Planctomycetaceae bacterium]
MINVAPRHSSGWGRSIGLVVMFMILATCGGCSLFVMAGKMLWGDPLQPAQFRAMTGVNLTKGKHKVLVVCTVPAAISEDFSSLSVDLIEGIARRMKIQGIDVISPSAVASWLDDHGSLITNPNDLAQDFEVDYIAWIEVLKFSLREDEEPTKASSHLLRGRAQGYTRAFKVEKVGEDKLALGVYTTEFTIVYPPHQPVSDLNRSALLFQREFIDRVCNQLAEQFYDHRPGTDI